MSVESEQLAALDLAARERAQQIADVREHYEQEAEAVTVKYDERQRAEREARRRRQSSPPVDVTLDQEPMTNARADELLRLADGDNT